MIAAAMATHPPHHHPARPAHALSASLLAGLQTLALALPSPYFTPRRALLVALALTAASAFPLRTRRAWHSLVARLALYVGALSAAALTLGAPPHWPVTRPADAVFSAALALWILHAPLELTRHRVRFERTPDGALDLAESAAWTVLPTALVTSMAHAARAWSWHTGAAVASALTLALPLVALGTSSVLRARHRRWSERVRADLDPAWRLVDEALVPRTVDAHYRTAPRAPTVASSTIAPWPRVLHLANVPWSVGLVSALCASVFGLHPRLPSPDVDPEARVEDALARLHVAPLPCDRARTATTAQRTFEHTVSTAGRESSDRITVWSTGSLLIAHHDDEAGPHHFLARRCIDRSIAATWIADPRPDAMIAQPALWSLRHAPLAYEVADAAPPRCAPHERCVLAIHMQGHERYGVDLDRAGRFVCRNGSNEAVRGVVPARDAADLLDALALLGALRGPPSPDARIEARVRMGAEAATLDAAFYDSDASFEALRRTLCMVR